MAVDGEEGPLEAGVIAAIPDAVELSLPLSLGTVAGRVLSWSGLSLLRLLLLPVPTKLSCKLRACRSNTLSSASELPCDFEKKTSISDQDFMEMTY